MADNINVDPGTGVSAVPVATDEIGGVHFQRVKLDIGGDGVSSPVVSGNGLPVTGPLTDTELRATAVPVSGTVTANAGTGPWPVTDNGGSLTVDGSVTVSATNLDVRDLTSASDSVTAVPGANASTTAATFSQAVKTVSATGTPERLAASTTLVESVIIQAKKGFNSANTTAVFIGFSATNDQNYLELLPGDSVSLNAPAGKKLDLNLIYIDVTTNGDGVTYTAVN